MWNRQALKSCAKEKVGKNLLMSMIAAIVFNLFIFSLGFIGIISGTGYLGLTIYLAIVFLIYNPLMVGVKKFYLDNPDGKLGEIFFAFTSGNYSNIVSACFMRDLKIGLWSLLFVIPGIVKMFELFYVDWILIDNPGLGYKEVHAKAKEMSDNRKFDLFILQLSFILWNMISWIPILNLYIQAYISQTMAESYLYVKGAE